MLSPIPTRRASWPVSGKGGTPDDRYARCPSTIFDPAPCARIHAASARDVAHELWRVPGYVGATTVTPERAVTWATLPQSAHPDTWKRRLRVVRGFARYLHALVLATEVPGTDVLAVRYQRPVPFVYTPEGPDHLTPRFRAATYRTLMGLLTATGMRVGEAIRLTQGDLDTHAGHVVIRFTTFGKSRHPAASDDPCGAERLPPTPAGVCRPMAGHGHLVSLHPRDASPGRRGPSHLSPPGPDGGSHAPRGVGSPPPA